MRICILFILLIGFNSVNGQTDTTKSVITNSSFNIPGYLKINLVNMYDNSYPEKFIKLYLDYFNINRKTFDKILDKWANKKLFSKVNGRWKPKFQIS